MSLQHRNTDGQYPLHIVCHHAQEEDYIVTNLMLNYSSAIRVKDNQGNYPLNIACMNMKVEYLLCILIEPYPEAVCNKSEIY
jgi:ankyrin repeat protein